MASFETLVSHNYPSETLRRLNEFRKSGDYYPCDFTLVAEGQEIPVHRLIMMTCSGYFRSLIAGQWADSNQGRVALEGLSANALREVIEFAYIGSLEVNYYTVEDVIVAASYVQIEEAVVLCSDFLKKSLTTENCFDILAITERHNLNECLSGVRLFLLKNIDEIAMCDAFVNISFELLAGLLSEDALFTKSEYTLFNNVLKWIECDREKWRRSAAALMSKIRFPLLSKDELNEANERASSLQISDEELSKFLEEAREYQEDEYRQPLLQSRQTHVRSDGYQLVIHHGTRLQWLNFENGANTNMAIDHCLTYRPCVCVFENFMYTCGGSDGESDGPATERCFRFDPRFDRWLELTAMNESRKDFVTVAIDRCLYAIGGRNADAVALSSVEQFDINGPTHRWVKCSESSDLADTVYCHAGALYDGRIYISGGKKSGGCSNDLLSYDPETDVWKKESSLLYARCNHVMVAVGGTLYVIGGNVEDADGSPVHVTSIEVFDPMTQVWSSLRGTDLSIYGASAAVMDDNVYIVGGSMGPQAVRYRIDSGEIQKTDETSIYPGSVGRTGSCILQMPQSFPSG